MSKDAFDKEVRPRTPQQNKAMHVYFEEVANELNESGLSVQAFLKDFEIDYSKEMIKGIWRRIALTKFGKDSTADLTTRELQDVFEEFNRQLSKHGFHIPFPSAIMDFDEEFLKKNGII